MIARSRWIVLTAAAFMLSAHGAEPFASVSPTIRYRAIGGYDRVRLAAICEAELDHFLGGSTMRRGDFSGTFPAPRHAVTLYEVQFESPIPEWNNAPTVTGGLLAVPDDGADRHPLLSYQHGTAFGLDEVPSRPDNSFETRLVLAAFASQGYVVIAADYFGLGVSRVGREGTRAPNCYIIPDGTVQSMLDHHRACQAILADLGQTTSQLVLYGWSQGGWSTMQFLRRLEALDIPVAAAAVTSAPVDIGLAFRRPITNPQSGDAVWVKGCISNMIWAHEAYARRAGFAESAIREEYLAASRRFYAGEIDWPTYLAGLPAGLPDMFKPEFVRSAETGAGEFWSALDDAEAYRWRIRTPLRCSGGEADEAIPNEVARLPVEVNRLLGGPAVEWHSAGKRADHRAAFVQTTLDVMPWFDGIVKGTGR